MAGNPYHDKDGKFSSGPASGHNAGEGNREVAAHVKKQHSSVLEGRAGYYMGQKLGHETHPNFPSQVPKARPGSAGARQIELRKLRGY